STTDPSSGIRASASLRPATTAKTPVAPCSGARRAPVTWPRGTSHHSPSAERFVGGGAEPLTVELRQMRRRLLIASAVALVPGALAAPAVLAGNDYSDPAYAQHDLDNVTRS